MSYEKFVSEFFQGKKVTYREQHLPYEQLCSEDRLIPIILTLLSWSFKGTMLENKIVIFDLIKKEDSLLGLTVENVIFHNMPCINYLFTHFSFYEAITTALTDESVCITQFTHTHRFESTQMQEGDKVDIKTVIHHIFDASYTTNIPIEIIYKAYQLFDQGEVVDDVILKTPPPSFNLKKHYMLQSNLTQAFFDELTIVSTAHHLLENSARGTANKQLANLSLDKVELAILFSAILGTPMALEKLADALSCFHYQIIFPQEVYQYRQCIADVADIRTFDSEKGNSTNWYAQAKRPLFTLTFSDSIKSCLNNAFYGTHLNIQAFIQSLLEIDDEFIHDLKTLNRRTNPTVTSLKESKKIQGALSECIIGQKKAMEGIANGYLSSCIHRNEGPRMIYTFAGPSGVGKTYSANQFALLLNDIEKSGYVFNTFNMEQYSDEKDPKKLMGSGNQYTDASLGLLTNLVRAYPRQIILFDEIEKAHPTVIQSLLTVLDSGFAQDETTSDKVDFTQSIIIFTTNLGQDLFNSSNQQHQVNIFDVLRTSKNGQTGQGLAPEFVNRLAKGYSALFSNLKINHFIKAAEKVLAQDSLGISGITFKWPAGFASFLLKSLSPEITMRQIEHSLPELQAQLLQKSASYLDEDQPNIQIDIKVRDSLTAASQNVFLVLDDDKRVYDAINASLNCKNITLCSTKHELPLLLEKHRPHSILMDVDSFDPHHLTELIDELSHKNPQLSLFTYQLTDDPSIPYDMLHEEIREHFCLNTQSINEALIDMFERINFYIDTERSLARMRNKNQMLTYTVSVEKRLDTIAMTFNDLHTQQLVYSNDLRDSNFFSQSAPTDKLSDVIGLERAKKRLYDVIGWLKHPSKLNNFGISVPSGYLFAGPPGTGKTLLARAVAGECGLPFFSVSAAELSASHHGGTTQNIKKLFSTARKYAPAIVFIDEIDAIASARTNGTSGAAQDANLTVNALLTEMDGFDDKCQLFVLAATNHPAKLDNAITRPGRFDETIYCDLPNKESRKIFFTNYALQHGLNWSEAELLNLVALAQGMSPAEIQQVLKEAIQFAVSNDVQLTESVIEKTMIRVRYGSPSEHLFLSGNEKRKTAYHEAGHLVAHHLLFPKQHIDFITIEPRNQALGFVATRQPDEYESYSKITIMHKLQMLLAGRVAEKLCTGSVDEISTGASNDIEKATQLAMHAIYQGGIEPSVGPLNVGLLTRFEESDLLANAQNAVKKWLETAEKEVEDLLSTHYSLLEKVAEKLIDEESLMGHQISVLLGANNDNDGQ